MHGGPESTATWSSTGLLCRYVLLITRETAEVMACTSGPGTGVFDNFGFFAVCSRSLTLSWRFCLTASVRPAGYHLFIAKRSMAVTDRIADGILRCMLSSGLPEAYPPLSRS